MIRWLAILLAFLIGSAVQAETCTVRVHGMDITIDSDQFVDDDLEVSTGEAWYRAPGNLFRSLTDREPTCTSDVTLTFMASLTETYTPNGYCLDLEDSDVGYLLVPGERNFRGMCVKTVCERIEGTADELNDISGRLTHLFGEPPSIGEIARAETLGATMVMGSEAFAQSQANAIASKVMLAALNAPELATAGTVALIAVNGAAFACGI